MSKQWYVLRVQSGKEEKVVEAIEKKLKIAGLTELIGQILVPKKTEVEIRDGKQRTKERKIYPGYIYVEAELFVDAERINDDLYYLIKDTPSVGDFVGAFGRPTPMDEDDVDKILHRKAVQEAVQAGETIPQVDIPFDVASKVKIKEGAFENFDATVKEIHADKGKLIVVVNIFNRETEVELDFWQVAEIE